MYQTMKRRLGAVAYGTNDVDVATVVSCDSSLIVLIGMWNQRGSLVLRDETIDDGITYYRQYRYIP